MRAEVAAEDRGLVPGRGNRGKVGAERSSGERGARITPLDQTSRNDSVTIGRSRHPHEDRAIVAGRGQQHPPLRRRHRTYRPHRAVVAGQYAVRVPLPCRPTDLPGPVPADGGGICEPVGAGLAGPQLQFPGPDPDALAQLADTLSSPEAVGRLGQVIDRWIYTACLCFGLELADVDRTGFGYAYSVYQVEYSRNLIFRSGRRWTGCSTLCWTAPAPDRTSRPCGPCSGPSTAHTPAVNPHPTSRPCSRDRGRVRCEPSDRSPIVGPAGPGGSDLLVPKVGWLSAVRSPRTRQPRG